MVWTIAEVGDAWLTGWSMNELKMLVISEFDKTNDVVGDFFSDKFS